MGFAGEVATIGLPEVFSNIAFNQLTGVLTIRERARRATVLFEEGLVRAFRAWPDRSLDYAALAVEADAVSADDLERVLDPDRRRRGSLRELLRECRSFAPDRFDAAIETVVRDELVPLFRWSDAAFEFAEGGRGRDAFDVEQLECRLAIEPGALALDAARRLDEWDSIAHHIGSERDVFLPVAEANAGADEDGDVRDVLELLDGTRDVGAIIAVLSYGRFHVLRLIADLAERGLVKRADADELRRLAADAESAGQHDHAIRFHNAALALDPDGGSTSGRLALIRALVTAGLGAGAAREYKRLARDHERTGDIEAAIEAYRQAAALSAQETGALERMLDLYDERGEHELFFETGMQLGAALADRGLLEESLDIYQRLLERAPGSRRLRETVATTFIRLHEPKKAARELLALARAAWKAGDVPRALSCYRNVLAVDRECREAQERLAEITRARRAQRKRRRRRRLGFAAVTLLVGVLVAQGTREWLARDLLHQAARASLGGIAADPDRSLYSAILVYADAARDHGYTTAATEAADTLRTLLLAELDRLQPLLESDPAAGRRELRRLDAIDFPADVARFWRAARSSAINAGTG